MLEVGSPRQAGAVGLGVDLVHIPTFRAQLASPGTTFARVFRDAEWEYTHSLGPGRAEESLAARWAAKEAVIKAWSQLLLGQPPALDPSAVDWAQIEVCHDPWHRPYLQFHGAVAQALDALGHQLGSAVEWQLALSHDGDYALAEVLAWVRGSGPSPAHSPAG